MAKNIDFMGAIFPDVPSVKLPQQGGGLVAFDDTTDATATADKILQGYTAYAGGEKLVGTASGGITPTGTISITQNGQVDVTNYATADVNVSGGGGESKNIQVVRGTARTSSSTMSNIGEELTVQKTGTYDVYWSGVRTNTSSSYTYATQLYIDGTAYGSENSIWGNHVQNTHLSNVSLEYGQHLRVRGRNSRNNSYYIYAPMLVIVES